MRIVGRFGASLALGLSLAAVAGYAFGQTVVVGEERPQTEINSAVLDQLGPPPTLPDLLLGQQGHPPPGAAVKLHHPRAHAPATAPAPGTAKTTELKKPPRTKAAQAVKPSKPVQVATAAPPAPPKPGPIAAAKPLVSAQEVANADMPAAAPTQTPPPTPPANLAAAAPAATPPPTAEAQTPPPAPPASPPATQMAEATPAPPPAPAKPLVSAAEAGGALPEAKPQQQALLTPPPAVVAPGGAAVTIPFAKDAADLSEDAKSALADVAKRAAADESIQIQVMAYASGDEEHASKARRLSLSRALAVRSFLIDQGVHSTRIEVRALGNKVTEGPADRVDLVEEKR